MSEGLEEAAHSFSNEVPGSEKPAMTRDIRGRFVETPTAPEPMFELRAVEGDGADTSDGGENEGLRLREKEIADGRPNDEGGRRAQNNAQKPVRADRDGGHDGTEVEPEDIWTIAAEDAADAQRANLRPTGDRSDAEGAPEPDAEAGERYEVTVDGETLHVTLKEALQGYSRTAMFQKRMGQLGQAQNELAAYDNQVKANWAWWDHARRAYEEDVANMLPAEPNWDHEFAVNPQNAHFQQKIFQTIYGKLAASQQQRAQREAAAQQERDRQVQKYAVEGFSKFVMDNKIPDEKTLNKNLISMRATATEAGFNEQEVATVYDPRMLTVLLWASKYKRMMAARPQAVVPGKGRTLTPGSATPLGNAPRKGLDEALRQQAASGSLDATANVFRRLL